MDQKTILIVEDEEDLTQALVDKFTREGFGILKAKNGEDGLREAFGVHPDLILLDIIMPVMDGLTMLKKLRKDSWGKDVPVIILTNLSDTLSVEKSLESGVYDFLVKSNWKIEDLVQRVREKLNLVS